MRNYIKYAFRYLKREVFYSLLNLLGFSIGISCFIVILLYLQNELTYDRFNVNADRTYRIASNFITSGEPVKFMVSSPSLGPKLEGEYPEIESFVRINYPGEVLFKFEEQLYYEENVVFADSSLFDVFTFDFIYGNKKTSFSDPLSIILTRSLSEKYFGQDNPVGKDVVLENFVTVTVTGVVDDLPDNSHLPIDGIVNYKLYDQYVNSMEWPLYEIDVLTYVMFPENYDLANFWEKFPAFYEKYAQPDAESYNQVYEPIFHKMSDIHYNTDQLRGEFPTGKKAYLYIFGSIGLFILLLSSINYINISTARASSRIKEMGIKKVCGSSRGELILQFLTESFIILAFSIGVSLMVTELILEFTSFNSMIGMNLEIDLFGNTGLIVGLLTILILVGFLSGIFPALYLTGQSAVTGLTRTSQSSSGGKTIRNLLVVFQFTISIIVVNLMFLMNRQLNFINQMDLGFHKSEIITIQVRDTSVENRFNVLRQELLSNPDIFKITSSYNRPGNSATGLYKLEKGDGFEEQNFHVHFVNFGYLDVMGIKLLEGRDFDEANPTDRGSAVLVNKALVEAMGWNDPIGKEIQQFTHFKGKVIGVIENFNFQSLYQEVAPMMIRMQRRDAGSIMIRYDENRTAEVISYLQDKWKSINPNRPFVYYFLDEELNRLYENDTSKIALVKMFSFLSILISCIGLLGLTAYTAQKKTKEVGIRKAMGATVTQIIFMMFKSILILILIAFIVASLSSGYFLDLWLRNFAYQTNITFWIFILTGVIALVLVWITVSYHFLKIARKNPVEALRYE
jgi:putative ABC transport system permease protein